MLVELETAFDLLTVITRPTIAFFIPLSRPAVIFADVQGFLGKSLASNLALNVSICNASSSSDNVRTVPVKCTAW